MNRILKIVLVALVIAAFAMTAIACNDNASSTTDATTTNAPTTSAPATSVPHVTSAPVTSAPVTSVPTTSVPVTSAPVTSAPTTTTPIVTTAPPSVTPEPEFIFSQTDADKAAGVYTFEYNDAGNDMTGFVFSYKEADDSSFYFVYVSDGIISISKMDEGDWIPLSDANAIQKQYPSFNQNGDHTVTIEYDGKGLITVYIDGLLAGSGYDSEPLENTGVYGFRPGEGDTVKSMSYKAPVKETVSNTLVNGDKVVVSRYSDESFGYFNIGYDWVGTVKQGDSESSMGSYTGTLLSSVNIPDNLHCGFFFAGSDTTDGLWSGNAYFVSITMSGIYLSESSDGNWSKGAYGTIEIPGMVCGKPVYAKADYVIKNGVGEIKVYYRLNENDEWTLAFEVSDKTPRTGTSYGAQTYRTHSVVKGIGYEAPKGPVFDNAVDASSIGYKEEHNPNGSMAFTSDGSVHSGKDTIALKIDEKITNNRGTYVLKFINTKDGNNGLIFGHSRKGENTFSGEGTSYYFAYVSGSDSKVYIYKIHNGTETLVANWSLPEGVTPDGEHTFVVNYDGYGFFGIAFDGINFFNNYNGDKSDLLTGTGYGVRASSEGVEFVSLERLDYYFAESNSGLSMHPAPDNNEAISSVPNSTPMVAEPAPSAAGRYTLKLYEDGVVWDGIIFSYSRVDGKINHYGVCLDTNGVCIFKDVNGVWSDLGWYNVKTQYPGYVMNGEHILVVDYDGKGGITVYLDGYYVGSVYDTSIPASGFYGIWDRNGSGDGDIFRELSYEPLENEVVSNTLINDGAVILKEYANGDKYYFNIGAGTQYKVGDGESAQGTYYAVIGSSAVTGSNLHSSLIIAGGDFGSGLWGVNAYYLSLHTNEGTTNLYLTEASGGNWAIQIFGDANITSAMAYPTQPIYTKLEYTIIDGVGYLLAYYRTNEESDWILAITATDTTPLTGTAYGVQTHLSRSYVGEVKADKNVPAYTVCNGGSVLSVDNNGVKTWYNIGADFGNTQIKIGEADPAANTFYATLYPSSKTDGNFQNSFYFAATGSGVGPWQADGYYVSLVANTYLYLTHSGAGAWDKLLIGDISGIPVAYGSPVYIKIDYTVNNTDGNIKVYYRLTESAEWILAFDKNVTNALTGTEYGIVVRRFATRIEDVIVEAEN